MDFIIPSSFILSNFRGEVINGGFGMVLDGSNVMAYTKLFSPFSLMAVKIITDLETHTLVVSVIFVSMVVMSYLFLLSHYLQLFHEFLVNDQSCYLVP